MSTGHPSREEIAGFLAPGSRRGDRTTNRRVARHLLRQCSECRTTLHSLNQIKVGLSRHLSSRNAGWAEPSHASHTGGYDYGAAFAKAEQALSAFLAPVSRPEAAPEQLLLELEELPEIDQQREVAKARQLQTPHFIEHLILVANTVRYQDPVKTLHYTSLARAAAEGCDKASGEGALQLADLRAKAVAHHANALRICGRAKAAEKALQRAEEYRLQGTRDPVLRAGVLERIASLRIAQRRFEEAVDKADEAGAIYRELGNSSLLASTMVQRAIAALYGGEPNTAAALLNSAIPLIDMEDAPHLLFAALHNLVRCYIDLGRPEEALELFREARDIYRDFLDPILMLRAGWHEAQILRDLGRLEEAEVAFQKVRDEFLERDLPHDAALVSLDLAEVYVRVKDFAALKEVIAAAVPVFHAIGAEREILASWLQLQEVAHEEQLALHAVRDLARQLDSAAKRTLSAPR